MRRYGSAMAKLPALVGLIASLPGAERKTVELQARVLREAGLLTKGRRGGGAADVTSLDAAVLVLAHLATDGASSAPEAVSGYHGLTRRCQRGAYGDSRRAWELSQVAEGAPTPLHVIRDLIEDAARRSDEDAGGPDPVHGIVLDRAVRTVTIRIPADAPAGTPRRSWMEADGFECTWSAPDEASAADEEPLMRHMVGLRGEFLSRIGALIAGRDPALAVWSPRADAEEPVRGFWP